MAFAHVLANVWLLRRLILIAITLLGFLVTDRAQENELRQIEDNLRAKALLVEEVIRGRKADEVHTLQSRLVALQEEIQTRISLIGPDGTALADSARDPAEILNQGIYPEIQQARVDRHGTDRRVSVSVGQPMLYYAMRTDASPAVADVRAGPAAGTGPGPGG